MGRKNEPMYFVVEGSGTFPFDMLRYDEAFPASSSDANAMGRDDQSRSVLLCGRATNAPTVGRWNSFCWNVVGQSTDKYEMIRLQESRETAKPVPA